MYPAHMPRVCLGHVHPVHPINTGTVRGPTTLSNASVGTTESVIVQHTRHIPWAQWDSPSALSLQHVYAHIHVACRLFYLVLLPWPHCAWAASSLSSRRNASTAVAGPSRPMRAIHLLGNRLSGTLPAWFSSLLPNSTTPAYAGMGTREMDLQIDLSYNNFTGASRKPVTPVATDWRGRSVTTGGVAAVAGTPETPPLYCLPHADYFGPGA